MPTLLAIIPHADDAAFFCGGTLAKRAAQGWNVVLARVTNDASDSVGLTRDDTIRRNADELREAAAALGVDHIEELGYETDTLADVSLVGLRERFVYLIRKHRPFAVFTFDPYAQYEPNRDHVRIAQAVEEAFWVSRFDLHHPEHFTDGLTPFAVCEQWYFARRLPHQNWVEDITACLDQKINAACAHRTMIENIFSQCRMLLDAWGSPVPPTVHDAFAANPGDLLRASITRQTMETARVGGLSTGSSAEAFRVVRFGDMAGVFEALGMDMPNNMP